MIELTGEMVTAAAEVAEDEMIRRLGRDLGTIHRDDIIRAVLAAGFAIVERDYRVARRLRTDLTPEKMAALPGPRRRLRACVERWPLAEIEGGYDPRCCRFPKSCSASVYDDQVTEDDLEPEL